MTSEIGPSPAKLDYFAAPGLSNSGMKDLAISPLRFWHRHVNPNRPKDAPTPEMQFGSALHCAVLEPEHFDARYAREVEAPEGCLVTMDDLRNWLRSTGTAPRGTRKADVIAQVQAIDPDVPILDVLQAEHAAATAGKVVFSAEDWARIQGAKESLLSEPRVQEILESGVPEVATFTTDPETGVTLKAKMDWVRPDLTLDLKTFSQKRGKSIDRSISDAILYERYYVQAYFYTMLRKLNGTKPRPRFILAFVESTEPFEVRLVELRPTAMGEVNIYWDTARHQVRTLIELYANCMEHFGDKPWRYAQDITELTDQDVPGVAYGA